MQTNGGRRRGGWAKVGFAAAALLALLAGCMRAPGEADLHRYSAQFLDLFDTVTSIVGYARSEEEFSAAVQQIYDDLEEYHCLFSAYEDFPGVHNIKTINDQAGIAPVQVDARLMELLLFCRKMAQETGGLVDITMGSVLSLWHDAREQALQSPQSARLPETQALQSAAQHTGFAKLVLDEQSSTVFLTDSAARLDVGAVAKGYAVERVCRAARAGMLVSVGGNVCATGSNPATGEAWSVGIQEPDAKSGVYRHTILLEQGSVVTSGDYQRYFTVDGVRYGHIISPDTLQSARLWRSVTVLCADSGVADALSTALFLCSLEEGEILLARFDAQAMWIEPDGSAQYSAGFAEYIRT